MSIGNAAGGWELVVEDNFLGLFNSQLLWHNSLTGQLMIWSIGQPFSTVHELYVGQPFCPGL
jgi:hypothetical protein